jgi:hypothetical protein
MKGVEASVVVVMMVVMERIRKEEGASHPSSKHKFKSPGPTLPPSSFPSLASPRLSSGARGPGIKGGK